MAAKLARFSWLPGGLAATLVVAIAHLASPAPFAQIELAIYDRVQRSTAQAPSPDIAVIAIDDDSLAKLGAWPWPRDVHATLIDRLHADGARVIAFTAPFGAPQSSAEREHIRAALALLESSDLGSSEQARQLRRLLGQSSAARDPDARLARAMADHGNVVLPVEVRIGAPDAAAGGSSELPPNAALPANSAVLRNAVRANIVRLPPPPFLERAAALGHIHGPADIDGVTRRDVSAVRIGEAGLLPSLALAIAGRALVPEFGGTQAGAIAFASPGMLRLGEKRIPLDTELNLRPQYVSLRNHEAGAHFPYWQVLAGEMPVGALRDKIVIVGFMDTEAARAAALATPVSPLSPPVLTAADTVMSLMESNVYSHPAPVRIAEWLIAGGAILFAAFALPAAGLVFGALATALIVTILAVTEVGLLGSTSLWMQMMLPCAAMLAGFAVYAMGEMIRRANSRDEAKDPTASLRTLGQTFQKQGQLDLAFETFRRCPLDAPTMELLYGLGLDYERRRQLQKASSVYGYIATRDPNYRDLRARRARVKEDPIARDTLPPPYRPITRSVEGPGPAPGTRKLGRYEIERELGKGAMGVVYLGRDPKINRVVAIKAIPLAEEFDEEDLDEAKARFFREAEMAGRLNHPAIVTVYDAGEDEGLAYIAMEYLRGQHLSHYTDPARLLPPQTVVTLGAQVADALHYAHRQNVVHRDIKPANIMFNPDTDELKITDFGIARLTDTSRTKTGIVLGTPSFMSPEQLEGRTLDGRSDQFALGVSMYQLLCGQLPFRAESMPRLMQKIATEPHAQIRLVRPELPASLESILDRALAKDPDDRYQNCAALAAALRDCAQREDLGGRAA